MKTYKQEVLSILKTKVNKRKAKWFTGYELQSIEENVGWPTSLRDSSIMRTLRQLKTDGVIDYVCTDQKTSKYKLLSM